MYTHKRAEQNLYNMIFIQCQWPLPNFTYGIFYQHNMFWLAKGEDPTQVA